MADVTKRMLDLLALLQTGRTYAGGELARALDVSERTMRRDVDRLRGYGYPVSTRPGPGGLYRLAPGRTMPPLMLEDDEAVALLLALAASPTSQEASPGSSAEAAARAYGKLDQILPARLAATVASLREGLEADGPRAPRARLTDITALAAAIRERHLVEFTYRREERVTRRRVEPHRLVHHLLRWYLVAWDADQEDWRAFRLDRAEALHVRTRTFPPRPLPADTGLEVVRSGVTRGAARVELTVDAGADQVLAALPYEDLELSTGAEGSTHVVLRCADRHWLAMILSRLDAPVVVHEPQEWARQIRRQAAEISVGPSSRPRTVP